MLIKLIKPSSEDLGRVWGLGFIGSRVSNSESDRTPESLPRNLRHFIHRRWATARCLHLRRSASGAGVLTGLAVDLRSRTSGLCEGGRLRALGFIGLMSGFHVCLRACVCAYNINARLPCLSACVCVCVRVCLCRLPKVLVSGTWLVPATLPA